MQVTVFYSESEGHMFYDNHFENPGRIKETVEFLKRRISPLFFPDPIICNNYVEHLMKYVNVNYLTSTKQSRICLNNVDKNICGAIHTDDQCPICNSSFFGWNHDNDTYLTSLTLQDVKYCISLIVHQLNLIKQGLKYGYILIRPPGHHCYKEPHGFCVANNIVIAATYAQGIGYRRIFILDWDYHYPDGTYKFVKRDPNIFLFSIHAYGQNIFPGKRYGHKNSNKENVFNYPLSPTKKYTDDFYLDIIRSSTIPKISEFGTDLILISNGLDAHRDDFLCGLGVTNVFYLEATKLLKELNIPMVYILEGGYNPKVISEVSLDIIVELAK